MVQRIHMNTKMKNTVLPNITAAPIIAWIFGSVTSSSAPLTTGGTVTLRPAVENEFSSFLSARTSLFPAGKFTGTGKNWFVGLSLDAGAGFVETLPSIVWTEESALVHGPLTAAP